MQPNILIFMTDQEQADVVRPDHPCITPNAEHLARKGVTFRRSFCPTAHCCPSRATFMTGLYPSRHGIYNNVSNPTAIHRSLYPNVVTFSEILREAGYNLAYTGKWHVTDSENPSDRGWNELVIRAGKGSYMHQSIDSWKSRRHTCSSRNERERGVIQRPGWGDYRLYGSYYSGAPRGYEDSPDYEVVRSALQALPELASQDSPWCLFVGPGGPHDPFIVPEHFLRMYDSTDIPLPVSYTDRLLDKPAVYRRMREQIWGQLLEDEVRESLRHYWAYCTMEDAMFGELLEALENTGQAENTLVLRISDHGDYCGAHGLYLKGIPAFTEAYNIISIVRWPDGLVNPGREVEEFVTLADFAPTFMELAGAQAPQSLTGRSLVPFLRDGDVPDDWPDEFCTQFNGVELYYTQRAVMTRDHKYVYNGFDFDELYDLRSDPFEMTNLQADPEYQGIKHDLVRRMWRFAANEEDELIFNQYPTTALAPWGPMEIRDD